MVPYLPLWSQQLCTLPLHCRWEELCCALLVILQTKDCIMTIKLCQKFLHLLLWLLLAYLPRPCLQVMFYKRNRVKIMCNVLTKGMSCFVGAPRIFQAVCQDKLFPQLTYFAKGREKDGEPVRAYFIVFIICFVAILIGNINFIAPIITNFFLITYAVMNYSTFTWSLTRSPGWRPTFKWYNKWVSLFASAECIALMFLVRICFSHWFFDENGCLGWLDNGINHSRYWSHNVQICRSH